MQTFSRAALLALAAILSACGGGGPPVIETLAKSVESPQCAPDLYSISQLDADLAAAGVTVESASCAWDGRLRPMACGELAGYLRVIRIPQSQSSLARALGYTSPADFPAVIPVECPPN